MPLLNQFNPGWLGPTAQMPQNPNFTPGVSNFPGGLISPFGGSPFPTYLDPFHAGGGGGVLGAATQPVVPPATTPPPPVSPFMPNPTGFNAITGQNYGMNPLQFATQPAAQQQLALLQTLVPGAQLNNTQFNPAGLFSLNQPWYNLGLPNQPYGGLNAGMMQDLANKYGTAPGSQYWSVLQNDLGGSQPGGQPALQAGGVGSIPVMQQQSQQQNPFAQLLSLLGQGGGGQPPGGQQNPFAGLYQLLTQGGGGTGSNPFLQAVGQTSGGTTQVPSGGTSSGTAVGGNAQPPANQSFTTPDRFLADAANDIGYARGFAANAGYPTNAEPVWNNMVNAMERNLQRRFGDLTESFNVSGNRFSTAFGNAATDFQTQAGLEQNALLGQMTLASQEAARQRELQAAMGLGQWGTQGAQQLANQDWQSRMLGTQNAFGAASQLYGGGLQSQLQAAMMQAQLGAQGAMGLHQGAMAGAQNLFNTENQAAMAQTALQQALQQMGLGAGANLSQLWQSNLGLGGELGQQQYGTLQNQINRMYQEWLRTQPFNNPMLPYLYGGATGYPPVFQPQYQPSQLPGILEGLGGIMGALPGLLRLFGIGK